MNKIRDGVSSAFTYKYFPVILLIIVNVMIAYLVVVNYGESWDEQLRYRYADRSLAAYFGDIKTLIDEKGSFYVMLAKVGSELLVQVRKSWLPIDAWHFMHFLSFQLGVFFFYAIMVRFAHKWVALAATLLFAYQPLLWGHAFINPKDIPFMSFFMASVFLGLRMFDSLSDSDYPQVDQTSKLVQGSENTLPTFISKDWAAQHRITRIMGLLIGGLLAGAFIVLIIANTQIRGLITNLIQEAYSADATHVLGRLFDSLAQNLPDTPLESYIQKGLKLYQRLLGAYALFTLFALLSLAAILFPRTARAVWRRQIKPLILASLSYLKNGWVLSAGVMLGLTGSVRTLGPAAGMLVATYLLLKIGRKALPVLLAYFAVAALATYLSWPALWRSPLQSYLRLVIRSSDFPWDGKVMFAGIDYAVGELPRSYLPVLMSIQITELALFLFLVGLIVAAFKSYRKTIEWEMVTILSLWLFFPIIAVMILQPTLYDNFRQFLFILPPIFIFAGIGLQAFFDKIKNVPVFVSLIALIFALNLYWNISLHPYEYVYYNSLVGGLKGAFRSYEMDYWATSYREATEYLNENAPPSSKVIVWGPDHVVARYARKDLEVKEYERDDVDRVQPADYAILSTRHDKDLSLFPEARPVFSVGRGEALFVVVKQFDAPDQSHP